MRRICLSLQRTCKVHRRAPTCRESSSKLTVNHGMVGFLFYLSGFSREVIMTVSRLECEVKWWKKNASQLLTA